MVAVVPRAAELGSVLDHVPGRLDLADPGRLECVQVPRPDDYPALVQVLLKGARPAAVKLYAALVRMADRVHGIAWPHLGRYDRARSRPPKAGSDERRAFNVSASALARELGLSPGTLSSAMCELTRRGLVLRMKRPRERGEGNDFFVVLVLGVTVLEDAGACMVPRSLAAAALVGFGPQSIRDAVNAARERDDADPWTRHPAVGPIGNARRILPLVALVPASRRTPQTEQLQEAARELVARVIASTRKRIRARSRPRPGRSLTLER